MSASSTSHTRSLSAESRSGGLALSPVSSLQSGRVVDEFVEEIRNNSSKWSVGNKLGVAYHFVESRLFKHNNVVNRTGARTRLEIRNVAPFFTKLQADMLHYPFVKVQLCGSAEAHLMYCHSKLVRLEAKRNILLLGEACFVQGHFNNYFAEPIPIAAGTLVKLYSRTFDIRISSNQHCIFMRTEDIIKNRIRMQPLSMTTAEQASLDGTEEAEESEADSEDHSEDELVESYEPDSAYEDEENSAEGRSRSGTRRLRARRGRTGNPRTTPQVMPPGAARRARLANASTQTSPASQDGERQRPRTM